MIMEAERTVETLCSFLNQYQRGSFDNIYRDPNPGQFLGLRHFFHNGYKRFMLGIIFLSALDIELHIIFLLGLERSIDLFLNYALVPVIFHPK